eukprot:5889361-Pleurochrysis_carterae.AAC.1
MGSELPLGGDQSLGDRLGQTSCTPSMRLGLYTRLRSKRDPEEDGRTYLSTYNTERGLALMRTRTHDGGDSERAGAGAMFSPPTIPLITGEDRGESGRWREDRRRWLGAPL